MSNHSPALQAPMLSAEIDQTPPPSPPRRRIRKPKAPPADRLTPQQRRCERAWKKVQTQPQGSRRYAFTMEEIAEETGITSRTVCDMRAVDRILRARGQRNLGTWEQARKRVPRNSLAL